MKEKRLNEAENKKNFEIKFKEKKKLKEIIQLKKMINKVIIIINKNSINLRIYIII